MDEKFHARYFTDIKHSEAIIGSTYKRRGIKDKFAYLHKIAKDVDENNDYASELTSFKTSYYLIIDKYGFINNIVSLFVFTTRNNIYQYAVYIKEDNFNIIEIKSMKEFTSMYFPDRTEMVIFYSEILKLVEYNPNRFSLNLNMDSNLTYILNKIPKDYLDNLINSLEFGFFDSLRTASNVKRMIEDYIGNCVTIKNFFGRNYTINIGGDIPMVFNMKIKGNNIYIKYTKSIGDKFINHYIMNMGEF